MSKDIAVLRKRATRAGFEVTKTKGQHLRWRAPSGAIYFTASTPSDHRSYKNMVAGLRRIGLEC